MIYVAVNCRALLGVVFLASGLSKVAGQGSFAAFARSVRRLGSLPPAWTMPIARAVVAAELTAVGLLAVPWVATGMLGFAVACLLLVIFLIAVVRSLGRGERAPCRCFGATTVPLGRRHVVRNCCLAGVALLGLLGSASSSGATAAGLAVAVVIGLVLGWLVTQFDHFAELFGPLVLSPARRPS
jgi:uncharacterized membrane protein YphA (DoxX/SURF4 family)